MDPLLRLKDAEPLTQGRSRLIFAHPHDPDLLVKVLNPQVVDRRFGSGTKWYKRRRRAGRFLSYARELQEHLAVRAACDEHPPFLQRIVGLAETDLGLGLVSEAIRDREGNLAPTLARLIEIHRFDAEAQAALATCLEKILESDVIVSDLNLGNFVYTDADDHSPRFVLIDGIGNNNILPFKAMSRRLNQRSKRGRFAKLHARIERAKRQFDHP